MKQVAVIDPTRPESNAVLIHIAEQSTTADVKRIAGADGELIPDGALYPLKDDELVYEHLDDLSCLYLQ